MCDREFWTGIVVGVAVTFLVMLFVGLAIRDFSIAPFYEAPIEHLGQAICDQEYGLEYDHYDYVEDQLVCKEPVQQYDGLRVRMGGGE